MKLEESILLKIVGSLGTLSLVYFVMKIFLRTVFTFSLKSDESREIQKLHEKMEKLIKKSRKEAPKEVPKPVPQEMTKKVKADSFQEKMQEFRAHRQFTAPFWSACKQQMNYVGNDFDLWVAMEILWAREMGLSWEKILEWWLKIFLRQQVQLLLSPSFTRLETSRIKNIAAFSSEETRLILGQIMRVMNEVRMRAKQENVQGTSKEEEQRLLVAYKVLELPLHSSEEDLKKSFNRLAKRKHPDRFLEGELDEGKKERINSHFAHLKSEYDFLRDFLKKRKPLLGLLKSLNL